MARYRQTFLHPGRYELAGGRTETLTSSDLAQIAENTRALLGRGYSIPVLPGHGVPGSADAGPRLAAPNDSAASGGRLVDVWQDADGALVQVIEVPDADAAQIESGRLVYTSPELRPRFFDSQGREYGPVIAHVALTSRPRNRSQAPLARVDANEVAGLRRSISETQPLHESPIPGVVDMSQAVTVGEVARETASDLVSELENDTARPRAGEIASDVASEAENDTPSEVADAIMSEVANDTEIESASEVASDDGVAPYVPAAEAALDGEVADEASSETASESQAAAAETSPSAKVSHESTSSDGEDAPQRELHRAEYRQRLTRRILASQKLPRGLRERLASAVEAVQLSDDGSEEPTLRVSDAVAMIEESLPPQMALAADELQRPSHPHGEVFFTGDARNLSDEEAARIAREQLTSVGLLPRRGRAAD
jgi:hypothetical protein